MALEPDTIASGAPMAALPAEGWASLYQPFAKTAEAGGLSLGAFGRLGRLALPAPQSVRCGGHAHHSAPLSSDPASFPLHQDKINP